MEGAAGVQFPDKARTHPMPRAPARSPAVGPAHSHAAPQALLCPRARNATDALRHPNLRDAQDPRDAEAVT